MENTCWFVHLYCCTCQKTKQTNFILFSLTLPICWANDHNTPIHRFWNKNLWHMNESCRHKIMRTLKIVRTSWAWQFCTRLQMYQKGWGCLLSWQKLHLCKIRRNNHHLKLAHVFPVFLFHWWTSTLVFLKEQQQKKSTHLLCLHQMTECICLQCCRTQRRCRWSNRKHPDRTASKLLVTQQAAIQLWKYRKILRIRPLRVQDHPPFSSHKISTKPFFKLLGNWLAHANFKFFKIKTWEIPLQNHFHWIYFLSQGIPQPKLLLISLF